MSKISAQDLITICRVLLLIIGQNYVNPKLLQPIVASICKVMTVKKPCVALPCFMDPRSLKVTQNAYFSLLTHTKGPLLVTFFDMT